MPLRQLTVGLAFVLLYGVAGLLFDRDSVVLSLIGNLSIITTALLVMFTTVHRRRDWAGCQRLFWNTIAIGAGVWTIGHIGWAYGELVERHPSWLEWHTVFSLCGGLGPMIALLARPHRGVRSAATAAVGVDIASYGLLAGFIYAYFVLVQSITAPGGAERTLLIVVQVFRLLLMVSMLTVAVAARRTAWGPTYARLAIGATFGFFLRLLTSRAIADGRYQVGLFYDFAWILPFLFYYWAAAAAPASPEIEEPVERQGGIGFGALSAMPLLLIPLIGYSCLRLPFLDPAGTSFRTLLTGLTTVVCLGMLMLRLAVQRGQLQRVDARAQLLAAATEQTGDLIIFARADRTYVDANDAFLKALGFSVRDLALQRFPQPLDHAFAHLADEIPDAVRTYGIWRGTLRRRRRDGSTFPVSASVVPIKSRSGEITHFVSVERDVTEDHRLRDQLVHSERLSAVGELVAGVAHEINNPLQAIVGAVELMMDPRADPSVTRRDLQIVRREAGRAGHIVRNLLSFVRRSAPDRHLADLNQIVAQTTELREYHLHQQNIRLVVDASPGPLAVLVNREEVQQIILNLLLNAEQAVERSAARGTIVVRTRSAGATHVVEVADDGPGIPAELRGRVFEPFFTTKEVGVGTGLGLSISHGIAAAHGGTLEVVDSVGGACFRLSLPAHDTPAPLRTAQRTDRKTVASRALVVDDEAPIRRLLVRLLERRGFQVAEAQTLQEALVLALSFEPGVVLCDVKMPGGGGIELYRAVRKRRPDMAHGFVFITGDTGALRPDDPELLEATILSKPFTASDLDIVLTRIGPLPVGDSLS